MTFTPCCTALASIAAPLAGVERVDDQHGRAVRDRGLGLRLHRLGAALRVLDAGTGRDERPAASNACVRYGASKLTYRADDWVSGRRTATLPLPALATLLSWAMAVKATVNWSAVSLGALAAGADAPAVETPAVASASAANATVVLLRTRFVIMWPPWARMPADSQDAPSKPFPNLPDKRGNHGRVGKFSLREGRTIRTSGHLRLGHLHGRTRSGRVPRSGLRVARRSPNLRPCPPTPALAVAERALLDERRPAHPGRGRRRRRAPPRHPPRPRRARPPCPPRRTAAPRSSSRASSTPSPAPAPRTAPSARSRPATTPTSTSTRSSTSTTCSAPPAPRANAGATQFCIVVAVRGPEERLLTKVIDAVHAVHDETGLEVACSLGLLTAEQAERLADAGRPPLQPQPRDQPRGLPADLHHPHLRRPRRHRPARDRRGHGAVLRRHPRDGRDARAAHRLRVRARRARPVRGAHQPPRPAPGHPPRRPASSCRRARRCRPSRSSGSCCRPRGSAWPADARRCSASCRRWACSPGRTR